MFAVLCLVGLWFTTGCVKSVENLAINPANMDTTVAPGEDFFQYANGGWMKAHPIPEDKTSYSAFTELRESNDDRIKLMFEELSGKAGIKSGSAEQKIADFYASGLDTNAINKAGVDPIKPFLQMIDNIKTPSDAQNVIADLTANQLYPMFYLMSGLDDKNSDQVIAVVWQSGLGLPEKDYYFNKGESFEKIRKAYLQYITDVFIQLNYERSAAEKFAQSVMTFETELAKASRSYIETRDPVANYNKLSLEELNQLSPGFDWKNFMVKTGYPGIQHINVGQPDFIKQVGRMMTTVPMNNWKTYLTFRTVSQTAQYLNRELDQAHFDFYEKTLSGRVKQEERWKRALNTTDGALGELVGQIYVEKYFPPKAKDRMLTLVENLRKAMKIRIEKLDWMTENTKKEAVKKLEKIGVKIGYPDKWRDYSGLEVTRESFCRNVLASNRFEFKYTMDKIGKPVDPGEWGMTPQTVNAYYSPNRNEIVFPAAILQPPFFDMNADDAVNYGAIGVVIGHEMTHGFDNQGRLYDLKGNLKDWWTEDDAKAFKKKTEPLVRQFSQFVAIDTFHVNGELTLGENIADLGGLNIAYLAYQISLEGKAKPAPVKGFTDDQRFFLAWAQVWRTNMRDETLRRRVLEDEHSPARFRINGPLFNMPEFYKAFPMITSSDKLYRDENNRIKIW